MHSACAACMCSGQTKRTLGAWAAAIMLADQAHTWR